jgi:putative oxidoreductase
LTEFEGEIMNASTNHAPAKWTSNLLSIIRFVLGCMFIQHGTEKLWAIPSGRVDHNFAQLHGIAGPIEVAGGMLLILGLFTRTTAFILCGEMAVAYFHSWAPRGLWPIVNGGEGSVVYCYTFLWLVFAGGGPLSLDYLLQKKQKKVTSESFPVAGAPVRT